jgi:hypothetical protein
MIALAVRMVAVSVMTVLAVAAVLLFGALAMALTVVTEALVLFVSVPFVPMPVLAMAFVTLVLIAVVTMPVLVVLVAVLCAGRHYALGQELHAALWAAVRLVARHFGMHRADVRRLFCRLHKKLHAALGTAAGLRAHNLRVHRTDIDDLDAFGHAHVHLGDERERLIGRRLQIRLDSLALLDHVCVRAQLHEPIDE